MLERVKANWAYAHERAEERFQAAKLQETTWRERAVHYVVGGIEWYVPVLGQVVALVDWYVAGVLRKVVGTKEKPPVTAQGPNLQKVRLTGKTAEEFLAEHQIVYKTDRDNRIDVLLQNIKAFADWQEADAPSLWIRRRNVLNGARIELQKIDEQAAQEIEAAMQTNDGTQLAQCWRKISTITEQLSDQSGAYLRNINEAFAKIETLAGEATVWKEQLNELKRFEAVLSVNLQLGKAEYEAYLTYVKEEVQKWPAQYDTSQFLACAAELTQGVVREMEKLCEARAIDEAKKKKQIEEARAKVTTFQAKDRAAYLAHMGIKESQDYSTFLECGEHGLADRGLNTLKDLECLQLNRWENHLIKLRQFCTAFAIDPTYEADEYKAFLPQLTLELYKKGGGIFVAEADRQVRDAMMSLSSAPEHATEALRVIEKLDKIRQRAELKAYIHQPDCVLVWRNMRGREGQKATLSSFQDMFQLERSDLYHLQSKQRDLF